MTVLLEMKERIKLIYSKYEAFIVPVLKFLLAFITFSTLNGRMGYMARIDDTRIMLIAALTCSFLPVGLMVLMAAAFSLMHMYALSMEVALVGLCMYLIMYLLFFRFSPKDSLVVVLTPLLFSMNIPYVVPIAVGLLCGPASIVSVGCGIAVFYLLRMVIDSAPNIRIMEEGEILEKVRFMVEGILGSKAMLVMIAAFVVTVLVVYLIRRMSVDYSWTIAMVTGAMINVVLLLIGDLMYDVNLSMGSVLLGSLLALVVAKVIEFFRFCVDYSRTEKVQFEDDEYYYYVKAVPKMTVSVPTKTVKRINSQRDRMAESEPRSRNPRQPKRDVERMASRRGDARTGAQYRNGGARSGRVAVGNVESQEELDIDVEDYEEWP